MLAKFFNFKFVIPALWPTFEGSYIFERCNKQDLKYQPESYDNLARISRPTS